MNMGVPAVRAPLSLLPNLPAILSTTGANVTSVPVPRGVKERGFVAIYDCAHDDGESVRVECHTEGAETVILALKPTGSAAKGKQRPDWLLTQLLDILKSRGATDLGK